MGNNSDILHSAQAEHLLKNKEAVMNMMHSPEGMRLMELLQQNGGAGLESAANSAVKGNPAQLVELVKQVMSTPDGAKTIQSIQNRLQK